jgi:5'-deoxynucleotidase YfbR-like HD superfamily hydrolase
MSIIVREIDGQEIDLENLQKGDIQITDIAKALSKICRFGGRIPEFYSVAQHSVIVASLAYKDTGDKSLALCGLLHDAAEAYLGDVITPLKERLPFHKELEARILTHILNKFLPTGLYPDIIWKYDQQAYDAEVAYFSGKTECIRGQYPHDPTFAKDVFIATYKQLTKED